jgi:hypothetical protein
MPEARTVRPASPKRFASDQRPERVTLNAVHIVALISCLEIGQPLGLVSYTSKSYRFRLVRGPKPNQTRPNKLTAVDVLPV